MSDPYLSEIRLFGFNFAPRGWAQCNGQILSISQNTALFSLLGTTYGGNGQTTFGLPNLQGRAPVNQGQGPGLSPYVLGQIAGVEQVTLLSTQMPQHNHQLFASGATGTKRPATGGVLAQDVSPTSDYYTTDTGSPIQLNPASLAPSGGNQPHGNMQPYLVMNWCIAIQGIFPSRN